MSLKTVDMYIEFQPTLNYTIKSYLKMLKTATKKEKKKKPQDQNKTVSNNNNRSLSFLPCVWQRCHDCSTVSPAAPPEGSLWMIASNCRWEKRLWDKEFCSVCFQMTCKRRNNCTKRHFVPSTSLLIFGGQEPKPML